MGVKLWSWLYQRMEVCLLFPRRGLVSLPVMKKMPTRASAKAEGSSQAKQPSSGSNAKPVPIQCHPKDNGGGAKQPYRCDRCPAVAYSNSEFWRHYAKHGANGKFVCRHCDFSTDFVNSMPRHEAIHTKAGSKTNPPTKVKEVKIAPKPEAPPREVKKEAPGPSAPKKARVSDAAPGKLTTSSPGITDQQRIELMFSTSLSDPPPQCKAFDAKGTIRYECDKCPQQDYNGHRFCRHYERHGADYSFSCPYCDYSCMTRAGYRKHKALHVEFVGPQAFNLDGSNLQTEFVPSMVDASQLPVEGSSSNHEGHVEDEIDLDIQNLLASAQSLYDNSGSEALLVALDGSEESIPEDGPTLNTDANECLPVEFNYTQEHDAEEEKDALSDSVQKCILCPFESNSVGLLKIHMQGHERESGYKCPHCSYRSNFYGFLKKHIDLHKQGGGIKYSQNGTTIVERDLQAAQANGPVHAQQCHNNSRNRPKMKKCPYCPYRSMNNMERHRKMHFTQRNYRCTYCSFSTDVLHALNYHKRLHGDQVPLDTTNADAAKVTSSTGKAELRCPSCPFRTYHSTTFKTHMKCHDPQQNGSFRCTMCSFTTDLEYHLTTHTNMHKKSTATPLSPSPAKPVLSSSSLLMMQRRRKIFHCEKCPYSTIRKGDLNKHFSNHAREAPFRCRFCDYGMNNSHALDMHEQLHLDQYNASSGGATQQCVNDADEQAGCFEMNTAEGVVYRCSNCPFETPDNDVISEHLQFHAETAGRYMCPLCSFRVDDNFVLNQHLFLHDFPTQRSAHQKTTAEYRLLNHGCAHCPVRMRSRFDLEKHMRRHTEERSIRCPYCSYSSDKGAIIKSHIIVHEEYQASLPNYPHILPTTKPPRTPRSLHTCRLCAVFAARQRHALSCHVHTSHVYDGRFQCRHCSVSTNSLKYVTWHRAVHKKNKPFAKLKGRPFACYVCRIRFRSYAGYRIHKLQLHPALSDTSKRCDMGALAPPTLERIDSPLTNRSTAVEAKKFHPCPECPYKSLYTTDLKRHRTHHNAQSTFTCAFCSFSTMSKFSLTKHEKLHLQQDADEPLPVFSGEGRPQISTEVLLQARRPPTKCKLCPYSTKHSYDLLTHLKMHDGNRPFMCTDCSYNTERPSALRHHEELHLIEHSIAQSAGSVGEFTDDSGAITLGDKDQAVIGTVVVVSGCRVYSCAQCKFQTSVNTDLLSHVRQHAGAPSRRYGNSPSPCSTNDGPPVLTPENPGFSVTDAQPLASKGVDPTTYSKQDGIYRCGSCPYTHVSYKALWNHMQRHRRPNKFKCPECTYQTGIYHLLRAHARSHGRLLDANPAKYLSPLALHEMTKQRSVAPPKPNVVVVATPTPPPPPLISGKTTINNNNNTGHSKKGRNYYCNKCTFKTTSIQVLVTHRAVHAAQQQKQQSLTACKECPYMCNAPPLLSEHMKYHKANDLMKCSRCTFSCNSGSLLENHVQLHTVVKSETVATTVKQQSNDLKCTECPHVSQSEQLLAFHLRLHRGRREFRCTDCTFSANEHRTLANHMRVHGKAIRTGRNKSETPTENGISSVRKQAFLCPHCPFSTGNADRLHEHEQYHEERAKYSCSDCSFSTADAGVLQKHSALHQAVSKKSAEAANTNMCFRYFCPKCSFQCEFAGNFSKHYQMHGRRLGYTCSVCDYSATRLTVVKFHEQNHHATLPLYALTLDATGRNAVTAKSTLDLLKRDDDLLVAEITPPESAEILTDVACAMCSFTTQDRSLMQQHSLVHSEDLRDEVARKVDCTQEQFMRMLGLVRA